ncbi:hypothetical protein L0U85_15955 [Glycomyces sp. L485]|uniref:hypothetical protein n=1 Tax=Glycomyces sp. L485 TaxID=2909235 RepID=UPI001F4AEC34|nr:hypothetical protein [Glycomyces sp. L485]MCH7232336.1 hypothetical protein [Glycomyces sp. L485]
MLTKDIEGNEAVTAMPSAAVYWLLAPVPASLRGTSVPSDVIEPTTVEGTTDVHNTDIGVATFVERAWNGIALGLSEWGRPGTGLDKRHGATRGRPPREHLRSL